MKKLVSLLTALALLLSLTMIAHGAGSPVDKKKFGVYVTGNIGAWAAVTHSVNEGDTYDLSVENERNGYVFVGWVIEGDYDVVSGDINSSKLTILPKSDIVAKAMYTTKVELKENEIKVEYTHNVEGLEDGNYEIVKKGENLELSASENMPGYTFLKWEIVGPYEVVSGSLNGTDLTIIPLGNVIIKQVFEEAEDVEEDEDIDDEEDFEEPEEDEEEPEEDKDEDKEDGKKPPKGDANDSEESPPTGMAFPVVGLIAAIGAAVVSKKLSK